MKKSYIVLITIAVFGVGAIALWPTKNESTALTYEQPAAESSNATSSSQSTTGTTQTAPTVTNTQPTATANALKDGNAQGDNPNNALWRPANCYCCEWWQN